MSDIFEQATRQKLRFSSAKGELTVEQLWDLNLTSLDKIGQPLVQSLNTAHSSSLIPNANVNARKEVKTAQLQLDILQHIINTKYAEQQAAEQRATTRARLEQLKEIAANKADAELLNMPLEAINAMIAEEQAKLAASA